MAEIGIEYPMGLLYYCTGAGDYQQISSLWDTPAEKVPVLNFDAEYRQEKSPLKIQV